METAKIFARGAGGKPGSFGLKAEDPAPRKEGGGRHTKKELSEKLRCSYGKIAVADEVAINLAEE